MAEAVPLLPMGEDDDEDGRGTTFPRPTKKARSSGISLLDIVLAVTLPWLVFALIECVFIFAYYENQWIAWLLLGMCSSLGFLFVSMGTAQARVVQVAIGLYCIAASCVGTCVGFYIYDEYASRYWQLVNGAEYKNVDPVSKGRDYADATRISFTPNAFVDTRRSLGYMQAGVVYCVAPVATDAFSDDPQYWAVGTDCCDFRSHFKCGIAENHEASSGVRVVDRDQREKYGSAIRMAQSVYQLTSSTGNFPLEIWSEGGSFTENLWESCLTAFILSILIYLVISVGLALALRKSILEGHSWVTMW